MNYQKTSNVKDKIATKVHFDNTSNKTVFDKTNNRL